MPRKETGTRRFGAFYGVFVPTFLSIVGVILFLRLGYIIGGAGILGAIAIIILTVSVTLATALSLSSIASNIRIGSGGAYSIVTKTLGLEIGGSIGVPLYLAQAFSVALYVFGFAEAWKFVFPNHSMTVVALITFALLFLITVIKTDFAVKVQVGVFILICLALAVIFAGGFLEPTELSVPLVTGEGPSFWTLFAIFFPAGTGLMSGIGMSGELTDPKKQIPKGILYGLGATTIIYLAVAVLISYSATPAQLLDDTLILANMSFLPELVALGILAATFSSALTMLMAAPRILQAMGNKKILPKSRFFGKISKGGEPRNAVFATCLIIIPLLFLGNLDSVAQVLTMFFLITYSSINLSVFIEQRLELRSFRPTFKVPGFVPFYGFVASLTMMFIVNPYAGIVASVAVIIIYMVLSKKPMDEKHDDVRSGLFQALSEWAAEKSRRLPESSSHTWKPNMLVPVVHHESLIGNFPIIRSIAYPHGRMTVLGLNLEDDDTAPGKRKSSLEKIPDVVDKFEDKEIFTTFSTIDAQDYVNSVIISMEAIKSQVFSPNILFLPYGPEGLKNEEIESIISTAEENNCGVMLMDKDEEVGLGSQEDIHVWISPKALEKNLFEERYYDLSLLVAYSIKENWNGKINIWMAVEDEEQAAAAQGYLHKLLYEARFPRSTEVNVVVEEFDKVLKEARSGDLHIIPFEGSDVKSISKISETGKKSFLFVHDSTKESTLA